jgi:hypothetical protein
MSIVFWDAEAWSNHELRSKPCRSISGEFGLTDLLLKPFFILTVHDHAQA